MEKGGKVSADSSDGSRNVAGRLLVGVARRVVPVTGSQAGDGGGARDYSALADCALAACALVIFILASCALAGSALASCTLPG